MSDADLYEALRLADEWFDTHTITDLLCREVVVYIALRDLQRKIKNRTQTSLFSTGGDNA